MEDIEMYCEEFDRIVSVDSPCGHCQLEPEECEEVVEEKSKTANPQFNSWEEILIAMVHDRPMLWDSLLPISAQSKTMQDNLWMEISDALGKSVETLQKKWRNLCDTYTVFAR